MPSRATLGVAREHVKAGTWCRVRRRACRVFRREAPRAAVWLPGAGGPAATPRGRLRLSRQGPLRGGPVALAPQRLRGGARPPRRGASAAPAAPGRASVLRRLAPRSARRAAARRGQLHPGPPRLGQTDRDGLLGVARAVLALANVLHLLAHELTGLRGRRLA